jgi:hypothetical protein
MKLRPVTIREARAFVDAHHRHSRAPVGAICAVGVETVHGRLQGVGLLGRPVARGAQTGRTAEITRVCTDGAKNAPSKIYGALARAARALGYDLVITYTLASEPGTSLRAAGFHEAARLKARPSWDTPSRRRIQTDLFGNERRPPDPKIRWVRSLS